MYANIISRFVRATQRISPNQFQRAIFSRTYVTRGIYSLGIQRQELYIPHEDDPVVDFRVGPGEKMMAVVTESGNLLVKGEGGPLLGLGKNVEVAKDWTQVEGLPPVVAVQLGETHSMALTADGDVYTWGQGGSFYKPGVLGHGDSKTLDRPKRIERLANIKQISAGLRHSLALDDDGKVYSWGFGEYGRLGHGSSSSYSEPALIEALATLTTHQIGTGNSFSAAATNEGIFTWGKNERGQLGLKPGVLFEMYNMEAIPTPVQFPDEPPVDEVPSTVDVITCSPRACFAYRSETGDVFMWGDKIWNTPTKLELKDLSLPIVQIAHGAGRTIILDADYKAHIWTRNIGIKRLGDPHIEPPSKQFGRIRRLYSGYIIVAEIEDFDEDQE